MKNPEGRHNVSAVVSSEAYRHLTQLCWEERLTMSKAINKLLEEDAERQAFIQKELGVTNELSGDQREVAR